MHWNLTPLIIQSWIDPYLLTLHTYSFKEALSFLLCIWYYLVNWSIWSLLFYTSYLVQASFFIAYVVTSGWTNIANELFQLFPLLFNYINRIFVGDSDVDFEAPSIPYHSEIPRILFFGLLGITYFILAPLILPFILVYFCLGYIIYRNQVCMVFLFFLFSYAFIFLLSCRICIWTYKITWQAGYLFMKGAHFPHGGDTHLGSIW